MTTFTIDCPQPIFECNGECPICHGTGQITTEICPTCEGARKVEESAPTWHDPYGTESVRCPTCTDEPYPPYFDKLEPRR